MSTVAGQRRMNSRPLILILGTGFLGKNFAEYLGLNNISFVMVGRSGSRINLGQGVSDFPDHDFRYVVPDDLFPFVPDVVINALGEIDHSNETSENRLLLEKKIILKNVFQNRKITASKIFFFFGTDILCDTYYARAKNFESSFTFGKCVGYGIQCYEIRLPQFYGAFMKPNRLIESIFLVKVLGQSLKIKDPAKLVSPVFIGDLLVFVLDVINDVYSYQSKIYFDSFSVISVQKLALLCEKIISTAIFPAHGLRDAYTGSYSWDRTVSRVTGGTAHCAGIVRYLSLKQCVSRRSQ